MNKYYLILSKIMKEGKGQKNKKGGITYLLNQELKLKPVDLLEIFEGHGIARNKLKNELELFQQGERLTEKYRAVGVNWWDYCGPTYFEKLPGLIAKINREKRPSKNYVLFLGSTDAESNQQPCLSLV